MIFRNSLLCYLITLFRFLSFISPYLAILRSFLCSLRTPFWSSYRTTSLSRSLSSTAFFFSWEFSLFMASFRFFLFVLDLDFCLRNFRLQFFSSKCSRLHYFYTLFNDFPSSSLSLFYVDSYIYRSSSRYLESFSLSCMFSTSFSLVLWIC